MSYIGTSLGNSIEQLLIKNNKFSVEKKGHLSSLLKVAGLVHDLGNPPFGHFGEEAIKQFFKDYFDSNIEVKDKLTEIERKDFEYFDGNVQAFRILRKLHYFGDEYSFNLSYPSLACVIKYPSNSIEGNLGSGANDISKKKFGYFVTELKEYKTINDTLLLNDRRHPAVYIIEAADDIAYCAADIEDGVKLGILNSEDIRRVFEEKLEENKFLNDEIKKIYKDLVCNDSDRLSIAIQKFRVLAQGKMIGAIIKSFEENYDSVMDGTMQHELIDISNAKDIRKAFKKLQHIVFDDKKIIQTELAGWEIIYGLLSIFIPAVLSPKCDKKSNNYENRIYKTISSSLRFSYENFSNNYHKNDTYNRIQLIVDFVSGMTDSYAFSLYQKLKGIKL